MSMEEFIGWSYYLNWEVEQEEKAHKKASSGVRTPMGRGRAPKKTIFNGK